MPPKKRNRRLFNSPPPTTGKAAIHLNEHYSSLPLDLKDIKKGHIFHSLIGNGRHVGSVQKILKSKTILGDFESSLYYSISKALVSLGKYRKLTDRVEFESFEEECKEDFVCVGGTPTSKPCVVTPPSALDVPHPSTSGEHESMVFAVPLSSDVLPSTPSAVSSSVAVPLHPTLFPRLQSTGLPVLISPVKTRRTSRNCKILRNSLRQCIAEKRRFKPRKKCMRVVRAESLPTADKGTKRKRVSYKDLPPKRLREHLKRRDETIERNRKKRKIAEDNIPPDAIDTLQNKIRKLEKAEKKHKEKMETLQTCLKNMNKVHGEEVAKLERFHQNRLLELEEELENRSERPTVVESDFRKDGKSYNLQMRMLAYECLMANVPTDRIPGLIESFAVRFGINLTSQDIPVKSTVENMVVELGLLSDLQIAEVLYSTDNITIGMDATTQEGCHVNEIHMTTENRCLVVALDELPGGTAKDYADHVVKSVEHLASVHCLFNEVSEEVMHRWKRLRAGCSVLGVVRRKSFWL